MGSGSIIGPSTPFVVGGDPSEEQHVQNAMVAYIRSLAEKNGYNVTAAVHMAQNNTAYSAVQATSVGLVSGTSETLDAFLTAVALGSETITRCDEPLYDRLPSLTTESTL